MTPIRIGLVGCGYWGPKVARAASSLPEVRISALIDADVERARALQLQFPLAGVYSSFETALSSAAFDAAIIATHPAAHFGLASAAIDAGKHALVEKPLALTSVECAELGRRADEAGVKLMVGHTFRFSPAVQHVKGLLERRELGDVYYVDSQRLNLGRVRSDVDSIWNFAPHDVSVLNYWFDGGPAAVRCYARDYLQQGVSDVAFLVLEYPHSVLAHIHVSWLSPSKVRRFTVVGSEKMVVYDDVASQKVMVFDSGIDRDNMDLTFPEFQSFGEFQLIQREGDIHLPRIPTTEPLVAQARDFVECIVNGGKPLAGASEGEAVVRVLEAATASIAAGGERVDF